jgi:hypothetical protein
MNARFFKGRTVPLSFILIGLAVILSAANVGQYLYFTGRIGEDAARHAERQRELESGYASLTGELDRERGRNREALGIVGGIADSLERTGGSLQSAIGLVRTIREEIKALEACLNN